MNEKKIIVILITVPILIIIICIIISNVIYSTSFNKIIAKCKRNDNFNYECELKNVAVNYSDKGLFLGVETKYLTTNYSYEFDEVSNKLIKMKYIDNRASEQRGVENTIEYSGNKIKRIVSERDFPIHGENIKKTYDYDYDYNGKLSRITMNSNSCCGVPSVFADCGIGEFYFLYDDVTIYNDKYITETVKNSKGEIDYIRMFKNQDLISFQEPFDTFNYIDSSMANIFGLEQYKQMASKIVNQEDGVIDMSPIKADYPVYYVKYVDGKIMETINLFYDNYNNYLGYDQKNYDISSSERGIVYPVYAETSERIMYDDIKKDGTREITRIVKYSGEQSNKGYKIQKFKYYYDEYFNIVRYDIFKKNETSKRTYEKINSKWDDKYDEDLIRFTTQRGKIMLTK